MIWRFMCEYRKLICDFVLIFTLIFVIFVNKYLIDMIFNKEADFEDAVVSSLIKHGWHEDIIKNPSEEELIRNWSNILYENNPGKDRLNGQPLTDSEMRQIMEQVAELKSPVLLNGFINGKTVSIKRDNPADKLHYGKEVSLKIYDRNEIAGGQSRYQIVRQPRFASKSKILQDRRGDVMLLINGMPVIHIELKKSDIPVSQAYNQIEKYVEERMFTGIYSLIQIFVAMTPEETVYFANPGPGAKLNKNFFFHWATFHNIPYNNWTDIIAKLLSIPMAHQLVGFYTVADDSDGVLKVMRSYQYYAASKIADKVSKTDWNSGNQMGGYVWHTTGSGKTMTSFKSAQLIANSKDADKVVFLMDRVELGTQSLYEYRAFADETDDVQATEDTRVLISKLKSSDPSQTLIVTSIQKMSRIKEDEGGMNDADMEMMNDKRIVFIVDECHRSTFGEMMITIKENFPKAVFFGFTGTPIYDMNSKLGNTTSTVFGSELHRYVIADGIRDRNVLGFDPYKCSTFDEADLRRVVALDELNVASVEDAMRDDAKKEKYLKYMHMPMAGSMDKKGVYRKGIEDYIKSVQYDKDEHRRTVVENIGKNWATISLGCSFHALFATSSIPEAIHYYRLFKEMYPELNVTALFDSNIDNNGNGPEGALFKEDGLEEIITDYNERYEKSFNIASHAMFKKDVSSRLSHKQPYNKIDKESGEQLDLLIVVDQMLTGFDSKWVNTLYLDKLLKDENIIQAFSRTNRLFGPTKPFGVIKYYRKVNTMERNIASALKCYSGESKVDLFVDKLSVNIRNINFEGDKIKELFVDAGIPNMERLPGEMVMVAKFAKLFGQLNVYIDAAKVQGFKWDVSVYAFDRDGYLVSPCSRMCDYKVERTLSHEEFLVMVQRYKEIKYGPGAEPGVESGSVDFPYDIDNRLTEINTDKIDNEFMNSRFNQYRKDLSQPNISPEQLKRSLSMLHKSFAYLSEEDQKFANIFLHDIESGDVKLESEKSFREYIMEYKKRSEDSRIDKLVEVLGLDREILTELLNAGVENHNINEFGRFDKLKMSVDKGAAKAFFEEREGRSLPIFKVNMMVSELLRKFILEGVMI